jgi:type I restriction enzyme S subunit
LIAKKQAIKQGMMQQLLTGKRRLPGFDKPWSPRRLTDMLSYEQPGRFLVQTSKQLESGRVPVLTAGKTFILGYTNESHGVYTKHPVIIFDDFTTASKYVDFDFKAKSSAMKILSAKAGTNLRFAYEWMQLIDFPLGDHKRYWISEYSKQEIHVPSEEEQEAISAVIADADVELRVLRSRLAKANAVKQSMMEQLLTGRTRLPVAEAAS